MVPLRLPNSDWDGPAPQPATSEEMALLNHLRFVSMGCRAKARTDLFEACALLAVDRTTSQGAFSEALMRSLNQALGKPARLYRPGTVELTFDETWLLGLATSLAHRDEPSISFLLASRVPKHLRRHIRFLMARISDCFSLA